MRGMFMANQTRAPHTPVLLREVLHHLELHDGGLYLDGTFGAGGYSEAILAAADTRVIGIDRDPSAIASGAALVARSAGRLTLRQQPFGSLIKTAEAERASLDGFVLDLGVSSMQLDQAERGFSFQADGPLDMRMSAAPGAEARTLGPSAADVVNGEAEARLADILYQLGEERRSRAIAAAIVRRRAERPIARTSELVDVVVGVLGRGRPGEKHPATRTFQALRLHVNDELGELARGLAAAEIMLKPGGRLVVVTFHSLEDRIVKHFIATRGGRAPGGSRHLPQAGRAAEPSFRIVNSKPVIPSNDEIAANPRARSAKLRAAQRTQAPPWPLELRDRGGPGLSSDA